MTANNDKDMKSSPSSKVQCLLDSWEKRASASSPRDVNTKRLAVSPQHSHRNEVSPRHHDCSTSPDGKKSTRQNIKDLALFASPRVVEKQLRLSHKQKSEFTGQTEGYLNNLSSTSRLNPSLPQSPTTEKNPLFPARGTPPEDKEVHNPTHGELAPKTMSIRDRMKAYERNLGVKHNPSREPFMIPDIRGKRGSTLGMFTPTNAAKKPVFMNQDQILPNLDMFDEMMKRSTEEDSNDKDTSPQRTFHHQVEEQPADVADDTSTNDAQGLGAVDDDEFVKTLSSSIGKTAKIDRDTLVLEEIRKMIRDAEKNEIEEDMDDEVKKCLEKAACESIAYTKRWYDATTDTWIHCPSLATIIGDYTLIEAAEEIYGDELPILYTVSLRSVASEVLSGEEELPEYIYRLAI